LLLVELDGYANLAFLAGVSNAQQRLRQVEDACQNLDPAAACTEIGGGRFAVLLPGCGRRTAVELASQLQRTLRQRKAMPDGSEARRIALSIGVATIGLPTKNFQPLRLLESAGRCLAGVQLSGGDGLKSIEIF
jgi:GGDEF domain-containing protein